MMLAVTFAFIMLGFGGAGGLINMSYQLNESIHNTQWVTGHFHLIFAGAIVIMYFMVAYELWPQLRNCRPLSATLIKTQLWLWFVGMMVLTMPWHLVGLLGAPRRMAYYDYTHPALAAAGDHGHDVDLRRADAGHLRGAVPVHPGQRQAAGGAGRRRSRSARRSIRNAKPPAVLNGFGLWVAMMIALTVVNYGYPIVQLAMTPQAFVPIIPIGER